MSETGTVRVLVWDENPAHAPKAVYPEGINGAIAAGLNEMGGGRIAAGAANLDQPEQGASEFDSECPPDTAERRLLVREENLRIRICYGPSGAVAALFTPELTFPFGVGVPVSSTPTVRLVARTSAFRPIAACCGCVFST